MPHLCLYKLLTSAASEEFLELTKSALLAALEGLLFCDFHIQFISEQSKLTMILIL